MKEHVSCHTFRRQLFHFQADELPEDERMALSAHMDACAECARRLEVEDAFMATLKGRIERVPAPPGLRDRVRAQLQDVAPRGRASRWFNAPWVVPVAASLLLAAILTPMLSSGTPQSGVLDVEQDVMVVDFECEQLGKTIEQQRRCDHPRHLNALRAGPGVYWSVSTDQAEGRHIVVSDDLRGHVLHVRGELFQRIRTLHVTEVHDRGLAPLSAVRRSGDPTVLASSL